jgi:hypothetical protein
MAKRLTLEDRLAALRALREEPDAAVVGQQLKHALGLKQPMVVAKAAELSVELRAEGLGDALVAAWDRMRSADDRGCGAKSAIVAALYQLEIEGESVERVLREAVVLRQREPVYGGSREVGSAMRGHAAMGLVRMGIRDTLPMLAELLADDEAESREWAADAMKYRGGDDAAAVLLYKLRRCLHEPMGADLPPSGTAVRRDPEEPRVIGACVGALVELAPERGVARASAMLDHVEPGLADVAALALGESRRDDAVEALQRWWGEHGAGADDARRQTVFLAMAVARRDAAWDWLLARVRYGPAEEAVGALTALETFKNDERLATRVREAAAGRDEPAVRRAAGGFGSADPG